MTSAFRRAYRRFGAAGAVSALVAAVGVGVPAARATPTVAGATPTGVTSAQVWLTTADRSALLSRRSPMVFTSGSGAPGVAVTVDDSVTGQQVAGVGAAMTESSAYLFMRLPSLMRQSVLTSLFSPASGIGLTQVRLPMGASDFALGDYTLDDTLAGAPDPTLSQFSLARDERWLLPAVRQADAVTPSLSVMLTPWSAPAWMKTSRSLHGGALDPAHEAAYARYLARAVAEYRAAGIPVTSMTLVNEPLHSTPAYPSMAMPVPTAARIAGTYLPAALRAHGQQVKVLGFDHNWASTDYPLALLADPAALAGLAGTAFHCYVGDPSAQAAVLRQYPDAEVAVTECSGGSWSPDFAANLAWTSHTLLVGAFRQGATSVLLWNLALDPAGGPTNGGCSTCRGVLTVDVAARRVTRNVEFYVLGHIGKFVRPGAVVVGSTTYGTGRVESVAFRNADGSHALVLHNNGTTAAQVSVRHAARSGSVSLPAGSLATLAW